jgi:hypothetical protein
LDKRRLTSYVNAKATLANPRNLIDAEIFFQVLLVRAFLLRHVLFKFYTDFKPVDINIKFFQEGERHLYSIESIKGRQLARPVQRTRSPIAPVPMDFRNGYIQEVANIPSDASHYCWLNGTDYLEHETIDADPNEAIMLLNGGLVYLDSDDLDSCRIIQILRFDSTENGRFRITKSTQWRSEYTQTLLDQDRFAVEFK